MQGSRMWITLRLWTIRSSVKRAAYLKKHHVFASIDEGYSIQTRSVPLYAKLIKIGNNVHVASNVGFVTHDVTHMMLNHSAAAKELSHGEKFKERIGCIEIGDNVFIGSGTRFLYDVKVGSNVVIGSGSVVNRDIPDNCVAAGIPARVVGTFDEFVKKHIKETTYSAEFAPSHENVCKELAEIAWSEFYKKRENKEALQAGE